MTSRWVLGLVALILVSLHSQFLWRTATGEIAQVPATDFRRDLEGALAIERGEVPYQRLGEINPEQFAGTSAADWWVAHSPAALAHARVLLAVVGYEGANTLMRVLSLFGGFGLAGALAYLLRDRKGLALTVGAAVLLSRPLGLDVRWGQALSLVGLGLLGVLLLVRSERVGWAKVLVGLLAAWKVWPIVFALFLPRRGSRLPDFVHVAAIATFINLAVLPYVGGASSLWSWVGVALPGNLARSLPESISVAGLIGMPPPAATLLFLFGLAVGLWVGSRLEVEWQPVTGALAYFVFAPLVWDFYWMLGFAALAWPAVTGIGGRAYRALVVGALAMTTVSTGAFHLLTFIPPSIRNWSLLAVPVLAPMIAAIGLWTVAARAGSSASRTEPEAALPGLRHPGRLES